MAVRSPHARPSQPHTCNRRMGEGRPMARTASENQSDSHQLMVGIPTLLSCNTRLWSGRSMSSDGGPPPRSTHTLVPAAACATHGSYSLCACFETGWPCFRHTQQGELAGAGLQGGGSGNGTQPSSPLRHARLHCTTCASTQHLPNAQPGSIGVGTTDANRVWVCSAIVDQVCWALGFGIRSAHRKPHDAVPDHARRVVPQGTDRDPATPQPTPCPVSL